jgi:hypothetical protein
MAWNPEDAEVGLIQASSVRAAFKSRLGDSGTVTRLLLPLNDNAAP